MRLTRHSRLLIPMAAAAVVGLALTGCTGDEAAGNKADTDCSPYESYGSFDSGTEVSVYGTIADTEADLLNESWADWETDNDIDIKYESTKEFETQIGMRAQGGNPPDLAIFPQPGLLADPVDGGYIAAGSRASSRTPRSTGPRTGRSTAPSDEHLRRTADGERQGLHLVLAGEVRRERRGRSRRPGTSCDPHQGHRRLRQGTPWCAGFGSGDATGWPGTDWVEDLVLRQAGPDVYDQWVTHDIPFTDPEIKEAFDSVGATSCEPGLRERRLRRRQVDQHHAVRRPGPRSSRRHLRPAPPGLVLRGLPGPKRQRHVGRGRRHLGLHDSRHRGRSATPSPVVARSSPRSRTTPTPIKVQEYLSSADWANSRVKLGGVISANKGLDPTNASSDILKEAIEILQDPNTTFRFDASDLMPGAVGAGTFWNGMVDWINGKTTDEVLRRSTPAGPPSDSWTAATGASALASARLHIQSPSNSKGRHVAVPQLAGALPLAQILDHRSRSTVVTLLFFVEIAPASGTGTRSSGLRARAAWRSSSLGSSVGRGVAAVLAAFFLLDYRAQRGRGLPVPADRIPRPGHRPAAASAWSTRRFDTAYHRIPEQRAASFVGLDNFVWVFTQPDGTRHPPQHHHLGAHRADQSRRSSASPTRSSSTSPRREVLQGRSSSCRWRSRSSAPRIIWKFVYDVPPAGADQIGLLNQIVVCVRRPAGATGCSRRRGTRFFLIVVLIWVQTGFAMVVLSAAIKGVPTEQIEAARARRHQRLAALHRTSRVPGIRSSLDRRADHDLDRVAEGVRHRAHHDRRPTTPASIANEMYTQCSSALRARPRVGLRRHPVPARAADRRLQRPADRASRGRSDERRTPVERPGRQRDHEGSSQRGCNADVEHGEPQGRRSGSPARGDHRRRSIIAIFWTIPTFGLFISSFRPSELTSRPPAGGRSSPTRASRSTTTSEVLVAGDSLLTLARRRSSTRSRSRSRRRSSRS